MPDKTVIFTKEKRERLRIAYAKAVKDKRDTFVFDGDEVSTKYARYLLEYLDQVLK